MFIIGWKKNVPFGSLVEQAVFEDEGEVTVRPVAANRLLEGAAANFICFIYTFQKDEFFRSPESLYRITLGN